MNRRLAGRPEEYSFAQVSAQNPGREPGAPGTTRCGRLGQWISNRNERLEIVNRRLAGSRKSIPSPRLAPKTGGANLGHPAEVCDALTSPPKQSLDGPPSRVRMDALAGRPPSRLIGNWSLFSYMQFSWALLGQ